MISIIVPVYNRSDEIVEFLISFSRQTCKNFEIVIVDDGSEEDLKTVIEPFNKQLSLLYICQNNMGPGLARNTGMKLANGDLFVFIDSDCTVPPDYIKNILHHFKIDDFDVFGGPDTYHDNFPVFLKAVNYGMTSFIGTAGSRAGRNRRIVKYYPRSFNMGIKRKVYEKIGGMIDLRHGQDMEYSSRILKAGFRVKYFEDVFVYHKRRTDFRKYFKQIYNWGIARHNLRRLDRRLLRPVHALPTFVILLFLLSIVGSFIWDWTRIIFYIEMVIFMLIILFVIVEAGVKYKSIGVGFTSVPVILTQVLAYGLGFLFGLFKTLFKKDENFIEGYKKDYYK